VKRPGAALGDGVEEGEAAAGDGVDVARRGAASLQAQSVKHAAEANATTRCGVIAAL